MNSERYNRVIRWDRRGVVLAMLVAAFCWPAGQTHAVDDTANLLSSDANSDRRRDDSLERIQSDVTELNEAVFAAERNAQRYEVGFIVPLWDRLRTTTDRLGVLPDVPFEMLVLGQELDRSAEDSGAGESGVQFREFGPGGSSLDRRRWRSWLNEFKAQGYRIRHTDWHQAEFLEDADGTARSTLRFTINANRAEGRDRLRLAGQLQVTWAPRSGHDSSPQPRRVEVTQATLTERKGPPAFVRKAVFQGRRSATPERNSIGAVMVYDLNHDGLPDILLGAANRVMWNLGHWKFKPERLLAAGDDRLGFSVAIVADVSGDGYVDLIGAATDGRLLVFRGNAEGRFTGAPAEITALPKALAYPTCITAGDIDGDGDLDLFVGQWRDLYKKMPPRYWDANDGDEDVYVANGNISGGTTQDYCTHFWCNDIYLLHEHEPDQLKQYFAGLNHLFDSSWDGYQVNCLLVNQNGEGFEDLAYLMDVGFDFDARRVISADLDQDGRVDLLIGKLGETTGIHHRPSTESQPPSLQLMRNTWHPDTPSNWIGVQPRDGVPGCTSVGAKVTVTSPRGLQIARYVTGDSFMCQHPSIKHFGLGATSHVDRIEVRWPNGQVSRLEKPAINRCHHVTPIALSEKKIRGS